MYLYELIEKFGKGASDEKMKKLTMILSDFLAPIKDTNKSEYWQLMRDVFGLLNDCHYDEKFAIHDVNSIEYTDKDGNKRKGAYWSLEQVKDATRDYKFPNGTNDYDVFVAANIMHSDLCKQFDDKQILDAMYSFFFADEDWGNGNKVWHYMKCKYGK